MNIVQIARYQSPAGKLIIGSFRGNLCLCDWYLNKRRDAIDCRIRSCLCAEYEEGSSEIIDMTIGQLEEYFARRRKTFSIPLTFTGTQFQCSVWAELQKIPYGDVITYAELACRINNPKATRAVASANSKNPISIIVPCHRVIGCNNKLTGYAGGLEVKQKLLNLESQGQEVFE